MKEYRLSTPRERITAIAFTAAVAVVFAALIYAVRGTISLLIFCGLAAILLVGIMSMYAISACRSRCVVNFQEKKVDVVAFPSFTLDISSATQLQALVRKNGQSTIRCLVFSDDEDNIVGAVPTLFTYKQGALAEPIAKEMAGDLGIRYKETTPAWEYDKEAFKEYQKQMAEEEKAERETRRQEKMQRRIAKLKNKYKD